MVTPICNGAIPVLYNTPNIKMTQSRLGVFENETIVASRVTDRTRK